MNRRKLAHRKGALIWVLAATVTSGALAAPDTRARAVALLASLTKTPETARVASESIDKAHDALRRADQLRASGDQRRGGMLEDTALEWAQASEQLGKTAERERELAAIQARTTELETKVFRAQALVEQTVARRARAEEALRKLNDKGAKQ